MKKVILLSLSLLAVVFMFNKASAWNYDAAGTLTLDINAGNIDCTYNADIYVGSGLASFSEFYIEGNYVGNSGYDFECTDLEGSTPTWTLQILTSILTNGSNGAYTIPAANVVFKSAGPNDTLGACATHVGTTTYTAINGATPILGKVSDQGAVCQVSAADAMIKVTIPAHTPVGNYTSSLTYTIV